MTTRYTLTCWLCAELLVGCFDINKVPLGSDVASKAAAGRDAATSQPDAGADEKHASDEQDDDHQDSAGDHADAHKKSSDQNDAGAKP